MKTTLIIYESHHGSAKKAATILGTIIGNTKVYRVDKAPDNIDFNNLVAVFGFYGSSSATGTMAYLSKIKDMIAEKPMAVVGIGLGERDLPRVSEKIRDAAGGKEFESYFSEGELRIKELTAEERTMLENFYAKLGMTLEDKGNFDTANLTDIAVKLALKFQMPEKPMPRDALREKTEAFIESHNTLALATGKNDWVRCTPLDYIYSNGIFYVITEGGLKWKGLWQNENISASIYDEYSTMANLKSMQMTGKASYVEIMSDEYQQVLLKKQLPIKKIDALSISLYLIRITPVKYEILNSDFKKDGFDVKQVLTV
jgi:uncharacterized protein YhbP (UPF0306 family)